MPQPTFVLLLARMMTATESEHRHKTPVAYALAAYPMPKPLGQHFSINLRLIFCAARFTNNYKSILDTNN